jgi:two-component system response regulator YesN
MEKGEFPLEDIKAFTSKISVMIGQSERVEIENELAGLFKEIKKLHSPKEIQYAIEYLIIHVHKEYFEYSKRNLFNDDLDDLLRSIKAESNINRLENQVKQVLMQVHLKQKTYQEDPALSPINKAKNWINQNLSEKITIQDISDLVYMNPTYFCQYFKKQTGITVLDYITDLRLETAKKLLEQEELKVNEIAQRIGYQDTKYFSRLFKQKWGSLPSEFRKKYKNSITLSEK